MARHSRRESWYPYGVADEILNELLQQELAVPRPLVFHYFDPVEPEENESDSENTQSERSSDKDHDRESSAEEEEDEEEEEEEHTQEDLESVFLNRARVSDEDEAADTQETDEKERHNEEEEDEADGESLHTESEVSSEESYHPSSSSSSSEEAEEEEDKLPPLSDVDVDPPSEDIEEEAGSADELEHLKWPGDAGSTIYRFQHDFQVVRCYMNCPDRQVYSALRRADGKRVVIVVARNICVHAATASVDADHPPREVRIMRRLRGGPFVAQILGWCPVDAQHYAILMEHYRSFDPANCIQGNLTLVAKFMRSFLIGLRTMHTRGVAHRDIAMDNILWNALTEEAWLIDFDLSAFVRKEGFTRGSLGRKRYNAPEKMYLCRQQRPHKLSRRGRRPRTSSYGAKADVYSAGVVLWMLLNGQETAPKRSRFRRVLIRARDKKLHLKYPEIDLLLRMTEHNPRVRISVDKALHHRFLNQIKPNAHYTKMRNHFYRMMASAEHIRRTAATGTESTSSSPLPPPPGSPPVTVITLSPPPTPFRGLAKDPPLSPDHETKGVPLSVFEDGGRYDDLDEELSDAKEVPPPPDHPHPCSFGMFGSPPPGVPSIFVSALSDGLSRGMRSPLPPLPDTPPHIELIVSDEEEKSA